MVINRKKDKISKGFLYVFLTLTKIATHALLLSCCIEATCISWLLQNARCTIRQPFCLHLLKISSCVGIQVYKTWLQFLCSVLTAIFVLSPLIQRADSFAAIIKLSDSLSGPFLTVIFMSIFFQLLNLLIHGASQEPSSGLQEASTEGSPRSPSSF